MEEKICSYFKYGYCKYKEECRKQHNKEICELGSSCENSKVCPRRHPKFCQKLSLEGFCRHGDKCAYNHNKLTYQNITNDKNDIKVMKVKIESLGIIVQEMATMISDIQNDLYAHKYPMKT